MITKTINYKKNNKYNVKTKIVTQAQYDALTNKNPHIIYIIKEKINSIPKYVDNFEFITEKINMDTSKVPNINDLFEGCAYPGDGFKSLFKGCNSLNWISNDHRGEMGYCKPDIQEKFEEPNDKPNDVLYL